MYVKNKELITDLSAVLWLLYQQTADVLIFLAALLVVILLMVL